MSDFVSSEPVVKPPLCRRRFLALLGFASAGAVASREYDFLSRTFDEVRALCASFELPDLPGADPAPQILTAKAKAYGGFLERQNFERLPVAVVLKPHFNRHGAVQNGIPPADMWKNIVPTLRVADRVARELGEKIHINSAYRSPAYNAACPGAARWSQHLRNAAIDMWFQSPPAEVAKIARKLRDRGLFRGGVGEYAGFTHIDTRGRNVDWKS